MANQTFSKPSFWSRRLIFGTTVSGAVIFFIVGIVFWGGFNTAMEATNTNRILYRLSRNERQCLSRVQTIYPFL